MNLCETSFRGRSRRLIALARCHRQPRRRRPRARLCGRSPTPTRPSICSGRSICCPTTINGARPSSTRRSQGRSSSWSRRSSTTRTRPAHAGDEQPGLLARPAAARRARAASEARRACRRDQEERLPAPGAGPDGDLGGGLHPARQPVQATWASRAARESKRCFATAFTTRASRSASSRAMSSSSAFSTRCPKKRSASCSKERSPAQRHDEDFSADARGLVAAATSRRSPGRFNHDLAASPELTQALIKRRNANWTKWIEQRMASPGSVLIAVGAGHLAGKDSVVEMLKKRRLSRPPGAIGRRSRYPSINVHLSRISLDIF